MKNLKNKIKNMKGITLISLVITIIILIILAGVTLNMLLGENGIINRTNTARDENEKATATETMNLKITNVQISKYAEEQRMPTLKELADNFCEDDDFQYVQETSEVASLTKITNNNPTSIYTKLKAYPYEFEINSSLQLASIDGVKVATIPANDDDTIVSMTKAELKKMIQDEIAATASSTSTSNIYSTTKEQIVGTWIDSRPLYRKYVTGTLAGSSAFEDIVTLDTDCEIRFYDIAFGFNNAGTKYIHNSFFYSTTYFESFCVSGNKLSSYGPYSGRNFEGYIEYTRKSDITTDE